MSSILLQLSLAFFLLGCATGGGGGLAAYEPNFASEAGIKKTLMQLEESSNSRDLDRYAPCLHEGCRYQNPSGNMGSKKDVLEWTKTAWAIDTFIKYGSPEITVDGDQAVVKIWCSWEYERKWSGRERYTYSMALQGERWLIMERK